MTQTAHPRAENGKQPPLRSSPCKKKGRIHCCSRIVGRSSTGGGFLPVHYHAVANATCWISACRTSAKGKGVRLFAFPPANRRTPLFPRGLSLTRNSSLLGYLPLILRSMQEAMSRRPHACLRPGSLLSWVPSLQQTLQAMASTT